MTKNIDSKRLSSEARPLALDSHRGNKEEREDGCCSSGGGSCSCRVKRPKLGLTSLPYSFLDDEDIVIFSSFGFPVLFFR